MSSQSPTPSAPKNVLQRRGLLLGAGAAAATALAVKTVAVAPAEVAAAAAPATPGEGYRLTPHVLRYYETAKV